MRGNTFQTLLIGGTNSKQEKMTFAQMLYKDMQWGEGAEAPVTSAPTLPERSSATPTRTTRPRPRYENTPHRPIVSLGERDFEELDPDVFEITFPPFVTVIPEMFTPKEKSKQHPDFTVQDTSPTTTSPPQISTSESTFPTFKLADSQDTLVTVSLDNSQPDPTIKNPASTSSTTSAVQETQAAVEAEGDSQKSNNIAEEAQRETTELQPTTEKASESPSTTKATTEQTTTSPTTTAPHIFVFTTIRTTTKTSPKRPQIVTAGTTTTLEPEDDPEAAASKMAIIIPSVIVVVWILLLIAIALFVCCRRRTSSAQLRPYGPVYSVQPTSYALKRNGKPVEGSYEDHLEKAARMSSEMSAYNQVYIGITLPSSKLVPTDQPG
ncbi:unnamed protein product [Haemonchus placei]|uniref:SEA domain-containing protein n=1 Tax=Haemonchus placei TaxID=6290 RepID=A0A0N4X9S7_HAEPC|nr:unnamed protein product [Haemonchus placei]